MDVRVIYLSNSAKKVKKTPTVTAYLKTEKWADNSNGKNLNRGREDRQVNNTVNTFHYIEA